MSTPAGKARAEVNERLAARRGEEGAELAAEDVAEIVRGVLSTMQGDLSAANFKLFHEVEDLADHIRAAKDEIAAVLPDDIRHEHIPRATDELDAIVSATEDATNSIMEAAERIEGVAESLSEAEAETIGEAVTGIYEACTFQDITGQRIAKVVTTLKYIEQRIEVLVRAFGADYGQAEGEQRETAAGAEDSAVPVQENDLLNGPQLPTAATKQEEIDALFDSL